MIRGFAGIVVAAILSGAAGQSARPRPAFEAADVHVSPPATITALSRVMDTRLFRAGVRNGRYEVRNATMVDLVGTAYGVDAERVAGGPSWLEFDQFDVTALVRPNTPPETVRLMLQSLLADRFKVAVHNDSRLITGLVLSLGKEKPKLKAAESTGKTGCLQQMVPPATPGPSRSMMGVSCRNMTMEAFATELKGIGGGGYVTNPVADTTGLKGAWDFDFKVDVKYRNSPPAAGSDAVTLADAIDKQLGLKLEEQKRPAAVIVVDKVNEKPTENLPDLAKRIPPPPPAEFEIATIKPGNTTNDQALRASGFGVQPGGRVNIPGVIMPAELHCSVQSRNNLA